MRPAAYPWRENKLVKRLILLFALALALVLSGCRTAHDTRDGFRFENLQWFSSYNEALAALEISDDDITDIGDGNFKYEKYCEYLKRDISLLLTFRDDQLIYGAYIINCSDEDELKDCEEAIKRRIDPLITKGEDAELGTNQDYELFWQARSLGVATNSLRIAHRDNSKLEINHSDDGLSVSVKLYNPDALDSAVP